MGLAKEPRLKETHSFAKYIELQMTEDILLHLLNVGILVVDSILYMGSNKKKGKD